MLGVVCFGWIGKSMLFYLYVVAAFHCVFPQCCHVDRLASLIAAFLSIVIPSVIVQCFDLTFLV